MISGSSNLGTPQVNPQLPLFPYDTAGLAARYADSRRRRKVKYIYQGAGVTSETAAMNLYRAIYQPTDGGTRIRGMTFAAPDAERAARIADDWELRGDRLLTVKPQSSRAACKAKGGNSSGGQARSARG
jgi:hypothetical protein